MTIDTITPILKNLFLPTRIFETLSWYLLSLMLPTDKHTQAFAQSISGKDNSLFSGLLSKDLCSSSEALNRTSKRRIKKLLRKRRAIEKGGPWTVALIIDSTLHERSSRHLNNAQRFNHGKGFVVGHQWTNIGILIAGEFIPLAPIAFLTREECKKRGVEYRSEHDRIVQFLRTFSLKFFGGKISPSEIVVLLDSGYDNKKIQKTIISRRWDFVISLKSDRQFSSSSITLKEWTRVDKYFEDGRRPWKTIRIQSYRGKKKILRNFKVKQRVGYLKGVHQRIKLVCSKRSRDYHKKHLACSNLNVSPKTILLVYKHRWQIEIFHREIKSYLGLEDAGVRSFTSLHNHVHWVYVAYNLLRDLYPRVGIKSAQMELIRDMGIKEKKAVLKKLSLINSKEKLESSIRSVIEKEEGRNAA